MAQRAQIIDITKTYLPGDPNSFVQTLVNTDKEDGEEKTLPPLLFEGHNFLPTSYGYRSYFGVVPKLDILDLTSRVQFVFSYQLPDYSFRLIALAEDGIWTSNPGIQDNAWVHEVTIAYSSSILEEWSACVIENVLYMYHQADSVVYYTNINLGALEILNFAPSFLNMAGQMGIFKAGTRLGFWDSANSTAWSSNVDLHDFTPSIENFAGNQIFEAVVGRIVTIRGHVEGFIIYCTKSIVGANFDQQGVLLWDAKKVFDNIGITHSRAITFGQSDAEHIVYTTSGIYRIGKYNAIAGKHDTELLVPEVYDFLRETRDPIWLDTINSRYVFFHILNPDYVFGLTAFSYIQNPPYRLTIGGNTWNGETAPTIDIDGNASAEAIRQLVTFGFVSQPADTTAIWTAITSETQPGTIGPFSSSGSRLAQNLGFTTADIQNSYITGTTLPSELSSTPTEHTDISKEYLGTLPQASVTVENAMGISLIKVMQQQMNDWHMRTMHQQAAVTAIGAATKVVNDAGVYPYYTSSNVTPPFAAPADVTTYDLVGTYISGNGNTQLQKDIPGRRIVLRKYLQEKITIQRKKVVSSVWRQQGANTGAGYKIPGGVASTLTGITPSPSTIDFPPLFGTTIPNLIAAMNSFHSPSIISPATNNLNGHTINFVSFTSYESLGYLVLSVLFEEGVGYNTVWPSAALHQTYTTGEYPWYLDTVTTYTYEITVTTEDMGHVDFSATMVSYGRTIIQVTSNPPTVVVTTKVPIFPVGPEAITFFPPTWDGLETLRIISMSALSPWHYLEGTFGIELIGDPISGAAPAADAGGYLAYGSSSVPGSFDVTYSTSSYLMQAGSFSLLYPTFEGSLVLDLHLKKWGKMKNRFTCLIDLNPVNQTTPNLLIAPDKGMTAGLKMADDDTIRVFDELPVDSVVRYGKIGHYRLGMTNGLETKAQFRNACTGILSIDASMDGRIIDPFLSYSMPYTNSRIVEAFPDIAARWFIISITGNYDLTGLEFRDKVVSRR